MTTHILKLNNRRYCCQVDLHPKVNCVRLTLSADHVPDGADYDTIFRWWTGVMKQSIDPKRGMSIIDYQHVLTT